MPLAIAQNQNFDHVYDGAMLLTRRNAKCIYLAGINTKCERGSLDCDRSPCKNLCECTALYSVYQCVPTMLIRIQLCFVKVLTISTSLGGSVGRGAISGLTVQATAVLRDLTLDDRKDE